MNKTPRTDALMNGAYPRVERVATHARELETELSLALEENERLRAELDRYKKNERRD